MNFSLDQRQVYVDMILEVCSQIHSDHVAAATRAMNEELLCVTGCQTIGTYMNRVFATLHRLRKEAEQKLELAVFYEMEQIQDSEVEFEHTTAVDTPCVDNFDSFALYQKLAKWILSEQQLKDNGYPLPHPDGTKGRATLYTKYPRGQLTPVVPNQRYCSRCRKPYMVDEHGIVVDRENCVYHYARKYTTSGQSKYLCCDQSSWSNGCCEAPCHVSHIVDADNLRGYVATVDKDVSAEEQGVFSLDCEMCFTTQGLELTRVTVINKQFQVVYETFVKPSNPIVDYNTRFSGISESDMKDVTTTLLDVQASLLALISSKTILIGHSLESDLKALKLIHNTVVDTSVMYPHESGPPFKRALKSLSSEYLQKIIQNDVGGHDSKADAITCMELVLLKVKEEENDLQ